MTQLMNKLLAAIGILLMFAGALIFITPFLIFPSVLVAWLGWVALPQERLVAPPG